MVKIPFLEAFPEYRQFMAYNLILEIAALPILILLIIQFIRRKHRAFELTLFFQMCLCDMLMVFFFMILNIAPIFYTVGDNIDVFFVFIVYGIPRIFDMIFTVTLLAQWLIYVEYTLHQSRDRIRRRYPAVFAVFVAAALLLLINIATLLWRNAPFDRFVVYTVISAFTQIVLFLFVIAAYVILYREKKRNRVPAYIRLTPTTLCMIAGFATKLLLGNTFISDYSFLPLFYALGLLFADYYMYRRLSTIDPKTGLYNRSYLSALIAFAKKKKLRGATVVLFRAPRANDLMAQIIKSWEPDLSKTINMGDGRFLLISEPARNNVVERFIFLISEQLKSEGIPVDASFETDRDAPLDEILRKYL